MSRLSPAAVNDNGSVQQGAVLLPDRCSVQRGGVCCCWCAESLDLVYAPGKPPCCRRSTKLGAWSGWLSGCAASPTNTHTHTHDMYHKTGATTRYIVIYWGLFFFFKQCNCSTGPGKGVSGYFRVLIFSTMFKTYCTYMMSEVFRHRGYKVWLTVGQTFAVVGGGPSSADPLWQTPTGWQVDRRLNVSSCQPAESALFIRAEWRGGEGRRGWGRAQQTNKLPCLDYWWRV